MIPEIIFQRLKSTATGVAASTGKQTEVAFNENFNKTKQLLDMLFQVASITVTSEQITQIKVDTTTTPYTLYYSIDPLTAENPTWIPLILSNFASLTGDPNDNIALKTILDSKASASDVSVLQNQMNNVTGDVSALQTTIGQHTTQIGANSAAISIIQDDLLKTVHTPAGSTLYLRYVAATNIVEYSLNGLDWVGIASAGATFASLAGQPTDNQALVNYITTTISNAIAAIDLSSYALNADLTSHVTNFSNPHQVTKAQVGLGNVENYSMQTMPVPASVQLELDSIRRSISSVYSMRPVDYRSSSTDTNSIYLTSKQFPAI